jgi:serine/threonine-protein kinase
LTPGAILADRYRIIGLLGRGGMGEVYRADDMKLGQPVALKFLPTALASDPVRRERFFAEVRITRQLAHPNICRVYDIAEIDGQHFLSMEYIDGEDLASLLKRIGYLTNEKALDIARQLTAGLAVAHEKGVLHRDLKPANIMLDGRGRVRITDFGLAIAAAEEETEATEVLGTPAYMAPEQFAGKAATTRSDIYALGLILYEIYSGKRAFTATTIAELRQQKESPPPTAPSEIRQGLDPVVDRLIMRCLERDPNARPPSVAQLALALPGGDPLAAALAAGETPSPEMVAASGLKEGLRPVVAIGILAFFFAGLIAAMAIRDHSLRNFHADTSPTLMIEQSKTLLRKVGYTESVADSASGFTSQADYARYAGNSPGPQPTFFWYRESPRPLETVWLSLVFGVQPDDPPLKLPGEALISRDVQGRLVGLRAIPPRQNSADEPDRSPDWNILFGEAGLDVSNWTPTKPEWAPVAYADTRAAWLGELPYRPGGPVRIEAASYRGKPVSFEVIDTMPASGAGLAIGPPPWVLFLTLVFIGLTLLLVRRNLRLGRGDRRGAKRLALINMAGFLVYWAFDAHHGFNGEFYLIVRGLAMAFITSGLFWAFYLALEPLVRRRWPQILISWTRLLSGEWRDPAVGREILVGCASGVAVICLAGIDQRVAEVGASSLQHAMGVAPFMSGLAQNFAAGMSALAFLCLLSIIRLIVRNDRAAMAVMVLPGLLNLVYGFVNGPWIGGLVSFAIFIFYVVLLTRFGLLAFVADSVVEGMFQVFPMTLDSSAWYSTAGYVALAFLAALALYGFRISTAGRPLFALGSDD